jgi:hypothetical protein
MHPGSCLLATAFFSIRSKNSSMRSSLISASTTMQIGMAKREDEEKERDGRIVFWGTKALMGVSRGRRRGAIFIGSVWWRRRRWCAACLV